MHYLSYRRFFTCLYILLGSFLVSSCVATSGIERTTAISAPGASLNQHKTYAWYQTTPPAPAAYDKGFSSDLHQHLIKAVEAELNRKGYSKSTQNPDLLLAYDVSVAVSEEKDKPELYGPGFGYSYAHMSGYRYLYGSAQMPGYRAVDLFKEGTLIVDVVDPKTNQLLWRGWTEGAVSNFKAGYGKVQGLVRNVLEEFPANNR